MPIKFKNNQNLVALMIIIWDVYLVSKSTKITAKKFHHSTIISSSCHSQSHSPFTGNGEKRYQLFFLFNQLPWFSIFYFEKKKWIVLKLINVDWFVKMDVCFQNFSMCILYRNQFVKNECHVCVLQIIFGKPQIHNTVSKACPMKSFYFHKYLCWYSIKE